MRYNVSVVEPLIEPATVADPSAVVTVQSLVCADGVPKTEFTTTMSDVMELFEMVIGNDENED